MLKTQYRTNRDFIVKHRATIAVGITFAIMHTRNERNVAFFTMFLKDHHLYNEFVGKLS